MTDRDELDLHAFMRQVSLLTAFSAAAATHETRPGCQSSTTPTATAPL